MRLVVFDCDGTIVDSAMTITSSMASAFSNHGLRPPPSSDLRRTIGLSLPEAVRKLTRESSEREVESVVASYKEAYRAAHTSADNLDPLVPGLHGTLDTLIGEGYQLGIATGKSRNGLERVLKQHGLGKYFSTLQTADDAPGKPHPAMLIQAMSEIGASPYETALIGDTTFDIEMAKEASAMPIGVSWGYHDSEDLIAAGAMHVLDSLDGLVDLLGKLLPSY